MPMGQLTQVLRDVNPELDERLLVGPQTVDDAGVVFLGEDEGAGAGGVALVQTVDFFPPVLDDPYLYGAVAAANALSDVYAMGGTPVSVLNLAGFPKGFDPDWVQAIFRGGFDKVREAGAVIAGGHTVEGAEPMFGFAVTGVVERAAITSNAGAQADDVLFLTKPLGMGSLTTAGKFQRVDPEILARAGEVMGTLNAGAAAAMGAVGAHACTDVTGFGLLGHASNISRASGVCLSFDAAALPIFEGALDLAREGVVSGGSQRGRASLGEQVEVADHVPAELADIAFDAETSGGLLIAVPEASAEALEAALRTRDVPVHRVGRVEPQAGYLVRLV